ncbi:MAG: M23 family metallopeptidase [Minisyncoccia bacterium]
MLQRFCKWLFEKITKDVYHRPFPKSVPLKIEPDSIAHTGLDRHAVDFLVPEGTPVCAPREGRIVLVRECSSVGGVEEKFADCANYLIIEHSDGERSVLIHLAKDSTTVKIGAKVRAGQVIARQGSTGWTFDPHIHFAVYRDGTSIPIRFYERMELPNRG